MIQRIRYEEENRKNRIKPCGLDDHGDDGDVLFRVVFAQHADDTAAQEEEAGGDEDCGDDIDGEGECEVGQGEVERGPE